MSLIKERLALSFLCLLSVLLISTYLLFGNGEQVNSRSIRHLLLNLVGDQSWSTEPPRWTETMNVDRLERSNVSEFGYMMALSFTDQITGSVTSLLSLQCLASALHPKLRVVEPFLDVSVLGVDAAHREDDENCQMTQNDSRYPLSSVKLTDVFSAEHWEEASKQMAPLVSLGSLPSQCKEKTDCCGSTM